MHEIESENQRMIETCEAPARPRDGRWRSRIRKTAKILLAAATLLVLVGLIVMSIPLRSPVAPMEESESTRYWQMRDGVRLHYQQVGTQAARVRAGGDSSLDAPIVFVHGGPGGYVHSSAVEVIDDLARRVGTRGFLYNQVGSGLSDRLAKPKDYSFDRHLDDLFEVVTEHVGEPVVLVGQSYGGRLVAHFTARYPSWVVAGVLASPGSLEPSQFDEQGRWVPGELYPTPADLPFREAINVREEMSPWSLPPRALASMALAMLNVKLMPDAEADGQLNEWATRFTKGLACDPGKVPPEEGGGGFYAHIWSNWYADLEDPRPAMRESPVPVLVVQGACDTAPYAAAYEYADLFLHGRYQFIDDAGHDIWWDRPSEFVRVLEDFLREAETGPDEPGSSVGLKTAG